MRDRFSWCALLAWGADSSGGGIYVNLVAMAVAGVNVMLSNVYADSNLANYDGGGVYVYIDSPDNGGDVVGAVISMKNITAMFNDATSEWSTGEGGEVFSLPILMTCARVIGSDRPIAVVVSLWLVIAVQRTTVAVYWRTSAATTRSRMPS